MVKLSRGVLVAVFLLVACDTGKSRVTEKNPPVVTGKTAVTHAGEALSKAGETAPAGAHDRKSVKTATVNLAPLDLGKIEFPKGRAKPASATYVDGLKDRDKRGLRNGHPALAKIFGLVIGFCDVQRWGPIRSCRKPEVLKKLESLESEHWPEETLLSYCHGMADKDILTRNMVAVRLGLLATPDGLAAKPSGPGLQCLLTALESGLLPPYQMATAAKTAALLAPLLGRGDDLLAAIAKTRTEEPKAAAYESLWRTGRLGVLPRLMKLYGELTSLKLKSHLLNGFRQAPTPRSDELGPLCVFHSTLLAKPTVDERNLAARFAAEYCPSLRSTIAGHTTTALKLPKDVGVFYVELIETLLSKEIGESDRSALVAGLEFTARDVKKTKSTRAVALRRYFKHAPGKARGLARSLKKDKDLGPLAQLLLTGKAP